MKGLYIFVGAAAVVLMLATATSKSTPYISLVDITLDNTVDYRYAKSVLRDINGDFYRSGMVLRAFKATHFCPATGEYSQTCPGYAVNHTCPLACGCVDAVSNMQYMKDEYKTGYAKLPNGLTSPMGYMDERGRFVSMQRYAPDRIELSMWAAPLPIPDTAKCVNRKIP
jgi:hypothetical protein